MGRPGHGRGRPVQEHENAASPAQDDRRQVTSGVSPVASDQIESAKSKPSSGLLFVFIRSARPAPAESSGLVV